VLHPRPVDGRDKSWRRISFKDEIFDSRARHYLEQRICQIEEVAEAYADRSGVLVKLRYALHWDHLPRVVRSITDHINQVAANGR
jgi:hypothetical protein